MGGAVSYERGTPVMQGEESDEEEDLAGRAALAALNLSGQSWL